MWSQISLHSAISSTFSGTLPLFSFLSSLTNSLQTALVGIFYSQQKCRRPLHAPAELLMSFSYLTLPLTLPFCLCRTTFRWDRAYLVWGPGEAVPCHAQMVTKHFSQSKMAWKQTFDSLPACVNTHCAGPQALTTLSGLSQRSINMKKEYRNTVFCAYWFVPLWMSYFQYFSEIHNHWE